MKTFTSASANKEFKLLEEEKNFILTLETEASTYIQADGEKSLKPDYSYEVTSNRIEEIDKKVCVIKHAVNLFNSRTLLSQVNMTIDQALVRMAQLNARKNTLNQMRKRLPVERLSNMFGRSNIIEYRYVNYDLDQVNADYNSICQQVIDIQMALDVCNQTVEFQIDLD